MLDRRLRVVLLVSLGIFLAGPRLAPAGASPRSSGIWNRLEVANHCIFAVEDVLSAKGGDVGLSKIQLPPSPEPLTISVAVKFLNSNLPGYTVWRDKVNRHVIHIVYRKALVWRTNPMNQKFTFHGTMTFMQLVSRVFAKRFPKVHFYYDPFAKTFLLPYAPDLKPYKIPLHFNVKNMTLRKFLTTGMVYQMDSQHFGGTIWQCYYLTKHGKLTGNIEITMLASPASATTAAGGPAKQTTAKTK